MSARGSFKWDRLGYFIFSVVPWGRHGEESPGGMSDQTLTCRDCGQQFTFTAGEQAFYQERGFTPPMRCPDCRSKRKADRNANAGNYDSGGYGGGYSSGPRQLYPAVCSNCGVETEVPFQPRTDKPVYCRECFQTMRSSQPRNSDY